VGLSIPSVRWAASEYSGFIVTTILFECVDSGLLAKPVFEIVKSRILVIKQKVVVLILRVSKCCCGMCPSLLIVRSIYKCNVIM